MQRKQIFKGYLLDSNVIIALLQNDPEVIRLIHSSSEQNKRIYFSNVSVCEILSGIKKHELPIVSKLFSSERCLEVTLDIAFKAGL